MTEQPYATDAYLREFDATVVEHREGALVLDRTTFHPTDGGAHVANTDEIGRIRIVKTENKGKANKRLEIALE